MTAILADDLKIQDIVDPLKEMQCSSRKDLNLCLSAKFYLKSSQIWHWWYKLLCQMDLTSSYKGAEPEVVPLGRCAAYGRRCGDRSLRCHPSCSGICNIHAVQYGKDTVNAHGLTHNISLIILQSNLWANHTVRFYWIKSSASLMSHDLHWVISVEDSNVSLYARSETTPLFVKCGYSQDNQSCERRKSSKV